MKKILITGADSYIGTSLENYLKDNINDYTIDTIDTKKENWREFDFKNFDVVFNVAGIAHESKNKSDKEIYYKINRDLVLEIADKAKIAGVQQFIHMSSMLIYNDVKTDIINKDTIPKAKGFYADSKLQADIALQKMQTENFNIVILRPPMIFGKGSKGNFPKIVKLAAKIKIFPNYRNQRSMLYIENLCNFIKLIIDNESSGVFFPQNSEYFCTSDIVKIVAEDKNRKILMPKVFNYIIKISTMFSKTLRKVFGNYVYDKEMSASFENRYQTINNKDSIKKSL
jgi:UDP-glucose 4-epimerase